MKRTGGALIRRGYSFNKYGSKGYVFLELKESIELRNVLVWNKVLKLPQNWSEGTENWTYSIGWMFLLILASGLGYQAQFKQRVRDRRGTSHSTPWYEVGGEGGGLDLVPTEIMGLTLNVFTSYKKQEWNLLTPRILFRRLVSNSCHILI